MNERDFQGTVERVHRSESGEELASSVRTALTGILDQPENRDLLVSLQAQADTITDRVRKNALRERPEELRQAAVRCALLLEFAKESRIGPARFALLDNPQVAVLIFAFVLVAAFYVLLLLA